MSDSKNLEKDFNDLCKQIRTLGVDALQSSRDLIFQEFSDKYGVRVDFSMENVRNSNLNKDHRNEGIEFAPPLDKSKKNIQQNMTASNDSMGENSSFGFEVIVHPEIEPRGLPLENPLSVKDVEQRQKNENSNKQKNVLKYSMPGPAPKLGMPGPKPAGDSGPKNKKSYTPRLTMM